MSTSKRAPAITPASFASFGALLRYLRQRARLSRAAPPRAHVRIPVPCDTLPLLRVGRGAAAAERCTADQG